ncbi:hypothetical protein Tco_0159679, partial [Tanacetum coccineum]
MDDPNITIEEYIWLEEEKARRCGKVYNWETAMYDKAYPNPMDTAYLLSGHYPVFIFSIVYTAYSLNEYSLYDTGINTAYPG